VTSLRDTDKAVRAVSVLCSIVGVVLRGKINKINRAICSAAEESLRGYRNQYGDKEINLTQTESLFFGDTLNIV
jgi:hypothetical protein